jgi:hypothetical protein
VLKSLVARTIAMALSGLAGFVLGERQGFIRGLRILESEVASGLSQDVELASCVRTGDTKREVAALELRIDSSVLILSAASRNLGYLGVAGAGGPGTGEALGRAKLYRDVVPPVGTDAPAISERLRGVRPASTRSPALAALVKSAGG